MKYPIFRGETIIGTAFVVSDGLYMNVLCKCTNIDGAFCRLHVFFEDISIDLGLWIPDGSYFVVHKKIPKKEFGTGEPRFQACDMPGKICDTAIRLHAEEQFPYIEHLTNGRLKLKDGVYFEF